MKGKNQKYKIKFKEFLIYALYILKAILRAIEKELEIVYIDKTGCFLENNNYRDWVS